MWKGAVRVSRLAGVRLALLVLALLPLVGCRVPPSLKIGLAAPFEGRWREVGYDAIYAARLAVREANESGGVAGYRIELVALDDGGEAQQAAGAAATLSADPDVVVVVGHWLPQTTAAAAAVYEADGLPFVALGYPPLVEVAPAALPGAFLRDYEGVTPFDETAGSYAGATYDAVWLALDALRVANTSGSVTRQTVALALETLEYAGLTGPVYQPDIGP